MGPPSGTRVRPPGDRLWRRVATRCDDEGVASREWRSRRAPPLGLPLAELLPLAGAGSGPEAVRRSGCGRSGGRSVGGRSVGGIGKSTLAISSGEGGGGNVRMEADWARCSGYACCVGGMGKTTPSLRGEAAPNKATPGDTDEGSSTAGGGSRAAGGSAAVEGRVGDAEGATNGS